MITAYDDKVKQYFSSSDSLPELNAANYYKFDKLNGYEFIEKPQQGYQAVGQGSKLLNLDTGDEYRYIISSIDEETFEQIGTWKKQP